MQNGRGNNGPAPQQMLFGLMFVGMFANAAEIRAQKQDREKIVREQRLLNFDQVKQDNQRHLGKESRAKANAGDLTKRLGRR